MKEKIVVYQDKLINVTTLNHIQCGKIDYDSFILISTSLENFGHDANLKIDASQAFYGICQNKKLLHKLDEEQKYEWIEFKLSYLRGDPLIVLFKMEKNFKSRFLCNYARKFMDEVVKKSVSQLDKSNRNRQTQLQFNEAKTDFIIFHESMVEYSMLFDVNVLNFVSKWYQVNKVYVYIANHNLKMGRDEFFIKINGHVSKSTKMMDSLRVQVIIKHN